MNAHEKERIETLTKIDEGKLKALKEQPVELEKEKSGWIDYKMLMGEIGLHRENCKRKIQDYRESSNPTQFQEIKYHESVGAEARLCCLIQWCKDFMFTTEEVEELGRQSKEQPVCGLEELVNAYLQEHNHDVLLSPYNGLLEFGRIVLRWQKEQMMKEAVEVRVGFNAGFPMLKLCKNEWRVGDKVKLIIIKED